MQATTQSNLGSLSSFSTDVQVIRDGQEQTLFQGDAIQNGDTLLNRGNSPVDVIIPGMSASQATSLLVIPPAGTAMLKTGVGATGEPITEVVSPNANELSLVSEEGQPGAELVQGEIDETSGEMSGLFGAGIAAGGAGMFGGLAAILGGGAIVGGLVSTGSGDDDATNNPNNGNPEQAFNSTNGLTGVVDQVTNIVDGTPLDPVTQVLEPVKPVVDTVSGVVQDIAAADPTGITDLISGVIGGETGSVSGNGPDGLVGVVNELLEGVQAGTADTPLAVVTNPLTDALQQTVLPPLDQGLSIVGDALEPVVNADPTGLTQLISNVLGAADVPAEGGFTGIPALNGLPLIGDVLGSASITGGGGIPVLGDLPVVGDLPLIGELISGTGGDLPLISDLPLVGGLLSGTGGDLPLVGGLLSGTGGDLPLVGELPLVGDLLSGISSQSSGDAAASLTNPLQSLLGQLG